MVVEILSLRYALYDLDDARIYRVSPHMLGQAPGNRNTFGSINVWVKSKVKRIGNASNALNNRAWLFLRSAIYFPGTNSSYPVFPSLSRASTQKQSYFMSGVRR